MSEDYNKTDIVSVELTRVLKDNRDEMMSIYAKLIANPYLAAQLVPDFRSNIMNTDDTFGTRSSFR